MTPFYTDDWLTVYGGDCREVMAEMPDESIDCIVTSPPYWGLRDYGTAMWIGGAAGCDHKRHVPQHANSSSTLSPPSGQVPVVPMRGVCTKCGAIRQDSQLGLEQTPEQYVHNLVLVFHQLWRLLKPSGTCWLNLGDSYNSSPSNQNGQVRDGRHVGRAFHGGDVSAWSQGRQKRDVPGLKPKDLVGIPWRVAFALQAAGWYLRSEVIWSKPNPMPESVTDRPTKSHEQLFLLTKSSRYYFDGDAVRETAVKGSAGAGARNYHSDSSNGRERDGQTAQTVSAGRNLRSVWNIATRPYPGAHFAVFPPELPERCIKAGSSEKGVCPECGAPWERVVERVGAVKNSDYADEKRSAMQQGGKASTTLNGVPAVSVTAGWRPSCLCSAITPSLGVSHDLDYWQGLPVVPAVVLDPFAGSGTVGMVANRLSRRAILIDLSPEYLKQQMKRNAQTPLGLTEGDAA